MDIEHPTSNIEGHTEVFRIGAFEVSECAPVLVIAEIGVNHDGEVSRALELVGAAQAAGADAVKLQIFRADALMSESSALAGYQAERCGDTSPVDMLRQYELGRRDVEKVVAAIRDAGMIPLATPFSAGDVDVIEALDLPAVKIASPDVVNRPLLERAARTGNPLLVSTGASRIDEIERAVEWLAEWGAPFALLHCVSAYPTAVQHANLCWIGELSRRFGVPVGYSDHTTEVLCGALAVAAGACVIEKHLTYDRAAAGPDHAASADPEHFAQYVHLLRQAERVRGRPGRRVLPVEEDVRRVSRQSIVLARKLKAGHVVREIDLVIQRPGTGIPAAELSAVVGRTMRTTADAGEMLRWEMLAA